MAGTGGARPGAGRKKGVPNKSTASLKAAFQKHETALVKALMDLTKDEDKEIRMKAILAAFERGWGKPAQPVTGESGEGPAVLEIINRIMDPQLERPTAHSRPNGNGAGIPAPTGPRTV